MNVVIFFYKSSGNETMNVYLMVPNIYKISNFNKILM